MASVAAHYKLQIPIARIRQYANTDKKGTNVLGMIAAAERLGFQAKGVKGVVESLSKIPKPDGGGWLADAVASIVNYAKCSCHSPSGEYHDAMKSANHGGIR